MHKSLKVIRENKHEPHTNIGSLFKEFILGGQDGLVNVLGVILGIAIASQSTKLVIIAGLAATFAEGFSMAAVAYTSGKAEEDYYQSQKKKELYEIAHMPNVERKEIRDIYYAKGFRGKLLEKIVDHICSDKKVWLDIMMDEELHLSDAQVHPLQSAVWVGLATLIGSLVPLFPFFFFHIEAAIAGALFLSALVLFITGALEAKLTVGQWFKKGVQLALIGMAAALIGFLVGKLIGA